MKNTSFEAWPGGSDPRSISLRKPYKIRLQSPEYGLSSLEMKSILLIALAAAWIYTTLPRLGLLGGGGALAALLFRHMVALRRA